MLTFFIRHEGGGVGLGYGMILGGRHCLLLFGWRTRIRLYKFKWEFIFIFEIFCWGLGLAVHGGFLPHELEDVPWTSPASQPLDQLVNRGEDLLWFDLRSVVCSGLIRVIHEAGVNFPSRRSWVPFYL